ncbi:sel1 repeat family protein [Vibrio parahaemolyticus]|uniref:Sel1 repeat family protein n=3 Tax=Vibrio parahaemolyticus TaxID=670 RepID=A0A9Q3UES9_VIBPH|nr:SEL1-like repeat protein [Vibrio parahaemolyticus]EHA6960016.1 sel1 repeat family protein [Vibrio parahaemolyticus]EHA6973872.1 sel1 repeat family protein [Vibrio parahaemolyticus]EHR5319876.1 sel1 repeat family protein [Vibrio parahaemolyticus]EIO3214784.1 sel1 repeat family protein [Vibrio parahaemolyticus]EJB8436289.1 sel1 repeat family protein [Vibrio parahaemolyticus]
MKKLTVIFSLIILSSFVGYIFIYKPHADQMRLESVVVNLEVADDGLREQMITDLKDIAESGNAVAQYRYAELLLRDGNVSEALPYLEKSSDQGELISTELLGLTYLESQDVEQKVAGLQQIHSAARQGLPTSQLYLGMCFDDGDCGFPKNQYLSTYWLEKAFKNGEVSAKLFLEGRDKSEISNINVETETQLVLCTMLPTECQ